MSAEFTRTAGATRAFDACTKAVSFDAAGPGLVITTQASCRQFDVSTARRAHSAGRGDQPWCNFDHAPYGFQRLAGETLARQRQLRPYAVVVLTGSFLISSYAGRVCATPGHVLLQPALDCHQIRFNSPCVTLIRLPWHGGGRVGRFYKLEETESFATLARRSLNEASVMLQSLIIEGSLERSDRCNEWPDRLANALADNPTLTLAAWANENGLARETVCRGFRAAYGVPPATFRSELHARAAWFEITQTSRKLAAIATDLRFADQAHMTRLVRQIYGAPPAAWRRQVAHATLEHSQSGWRQSCQEVIANS